MFNALTRLAISCRKDSVKELQLSPAQQQEFEDNAQAAAKIFEGVPKAPIGIGISTK